MEMRYQMKGFREEVTPLLSLITSDIHLESVWLSVMSMLEDIAAQYILSNVTGKTPAESLRDILHHVKDEQRHATVLYSLRPSTTYPDLKYYQIEEQLKKIGREFIMSFFNSAQLRNAQNRYAAYIHGAQTIERFPFRIYTLYLSMTNLENVKKELPKIIEDESEHIALGRKLFDQLSAEERMPLAELYKLEETVCLMMLKRMNIAIREHLNFSQNNVQSELGKQCLNDKKFEIAFNYALYTVEKSISPERAEYLQVAVTLSRLELRNDPEYKELEKNLVAQVKSSVTELSKEEITVNFNLFYNEMIYNTDTMALHYAYHCILQELENENSVSVSWA